MSEQKPKMILAVLLGVISVTILATASYSLFPSQEMPTPMPVTPPILVSPTEGPLTVAQGETTNINLTIVSNSNKTGEVMLLFYLGTQHDKNQPFPGWIVITTPPQPYTTDLPWEQIDTSAEPKPFTGAFDVNPVLMEPNGTRTVELTLHAAENATTGAYSLDVAITDYPLTFTFATIFRLTVTMPEQQAIEKGRDLLDTRNYTTGPVLISDVEEKMPNLYWHELFGLEKPNNLEPLLCRVVRFEQAARPGHFFEVWIDACTGDMVGGTQCR
jgi:hypothetical protein